MKFAVIAALSLASVSAAGTVAAKTSCALWNDCVADNSCATVVADDATKGKYTKMCILTTDCEKEPVAYTGVDTNTYKTTKSTCLKETTAAAKTAAGAACKLSSECVDAHKCGGNTGVVTAYLCIAEATCGKEVDTKMTVCESALRNAISMAVAAVAVAYAL